MTDKAKQRIIDTICNIQSDIFDRYNLNGRPYGDKYIKVVLDIAREVFMTYNLYELTPDVIDGLTNENAHTAVNAIKMLKLIEPAALYEFCH